MANNTVTPIQPEDYRKEIGPKIWHWDQVYFGPRLSDYEGVDEGGATAFKRYVVVEGDIVMHPNNGDWNVISVNERFIPTLHPRAVVDNDGSTDNIVVPSNNFSRRSDVMYVDKTSMPIKFNINGRVFLYGSQASHYKIFIGTNTSDTGRSIAATYNNNGQIIGDIIELELAAFERDVTNLTIKSPNTGYLRELPADGELVTIVAYSTDGRYQDAQTLVVSHENFAQTGNATKFIADINLVTPYLSKTDKRVIEIPRNMNINALALSATLTYNDGTVSPKFPVNGVKFSLHGADAFTSSVDMSSTAIVLSYALGADESAANSVGVEQRAKTEKYTLKTVPSDAAYSVKLFVIPVWNKQASKYELRYWLYDLRRDMAQEVTDVVEVSSGFKFDPMLYNQAQTIKVAINLMNVGSNYSFYRPNQSFTINLLAPGERKSPSAYYHLSYSSGVTLGDQLMANKTVVGGNVNVDLSCGKQTVADYLNDIYRRMEVIHIGDVAAPPNPTKFRIRMLGSSTVTEYGINDLVKAIVSPAGAWIHGGTVVVEFFAESGGSVVELGALAYPINEIS